MSFDLILQSEQNIPLVIGEKCLISIKLKNLKICNTNAMHIFLKVVVLIGFANPKQQASS